mmetsp:Transcript_35954/g.86914  ORF Transcript_35954/g.86914 Transcript_35954/m.86914 type:complete len:294 (+) Transcript_35954:1365-2246(+)
MFGSFWRRPNPISTSLGITRRFPEPIPIDWAISENGPTHTRTVRTLDWFGVINRGTRLVISHVRIRTGNVLARKTWKSRQVVIESIQPHGAVVGCETPLSYYDGTKLALHIGNSTLLLTRIKVESNTGVGVSPGLIDVCIDGTFGTSIHETTPNIGIKAKRIVHDVLPVWCSFLDNQVSFPVELFEFLDGSVLPRFVDGFQSKNCGVSTVSFHNPRNDIKRMLNIAMVDFRITGSVWIKLSHPTSGTNGPVLKTDISSEFRVQRRCPFETHGLSGIIKTILTVLESMNIKQDR